MIFDVTLSGPDMASLAAALLERMPYARAEPSGTREQLAPRPIANWRSRLLADEVEDITVEWGEYQIGRGPTAISVRIPGPPDAEQVVNTFSDLPFELAVLANLHDEWPESDYRAPAIGPDHALLGWGMIFKGAAHENAVVSRRWLAHGPFRTRTGRQDTTLVQFHELGVDGLAALEQAKPGHEAIVAGFLRPRHRYKHDVKGVYTSEDQLLRIIVNDRPISDQEMLDACAARRDRREDRDRPIRNIAFAFVDEGEARRNLERLWLRELECRVAGPTKEMRIDEAYEPTLKKPGWA